MAVSPSAQHPPQRPDAAVAIAQHLHRAREAQFSGSLTFENIHVPCLRLFFVVGRLVWASGGLHRLRRWRRSLKQICPDAIFALAQLTPAQASLLWEYEALRGLVNAHHISREQAKYFVTANLCEVIFDAIQASVMMGQCRCQARSTPKVSNPIVLLPVQDILPQAQGQWQAWSQANLERYSPNLSPLLDSPQRLRAQVSPQTYKNLVQMLRGQHSLRELAALMHQDLTPLSQVLIAYEQQRLLQMRITPDTAGSIPTPPTPRLDLTVVDEASLS